VESTREQILRHVRGHHETTVARLAEALGLSQQAVRRHLDSLRADGLVDVRMERHGVGRPALLFFATRRADEIASKSYVQLMSRLFRYLDSAGSLNGSGREVLERAFAGIAADVAAEHRVEVSGSTLDERVAQVSAALKDEGIVDAWRKQDDSILVLENGECPYIRLAEMSEAPCRADHRTIELLVGSRVEQTRRIVDGSPVCEYIVRPEPVQLTTEPVEENG
jgi:predicted ArsR family transcriptional regulator